MKKETETAYLAGGCYWCLDAAYRMIEGVNNVKSGYSGGYNSNPTYEQVCSGNTGHAETIKVQYDNSKISYADVLDIFFTLVDPTTLNRQGNDVGSQYRSVIFYLNDYQKKIAQAKITQISKLWNAPIVTSLEKLETFYEAEDYHQDYFNKNPESGYCQIIINPKLSKLKEKFATHLKKP